MSTSDSSPTDRQTMPTSAQSPPQPQPQPQPASVFDAWRFDVNAVANLGNLFAAPDDASVDLADAAAPAPARPGDPSPHVPDLAQSASDMANAAGAELEHASKAAQQTIGKAAEEIGKGWGSLNTFLDDILAAKPDHDRAVEPADVQTHFASLFPDFGEQEQVVDHFQCALLQKYRCYLNNATPEKTFPMRGTLYVSTNYIAMSVTDDGGVFGRQPFAVSVPISDVAKIQKGAKTMLRLLTKAQSSFIFAEFESDSHFNGALGLLEHMTSVANNPQPPEENKAEHTSSND